MPHCPSCNFPEEREMCPACHAQLVPARKSVVAGVLVFIVLMAVGLTAGHFLRDSFGLGFVAGFAGGIVISLGGLFASAVLIEYDRPA